MGIFQWGLRIVTLSVCFLQNADGQQAKKQDDGQSNIQTKSNDAPAASPLAKSRGEKSRRLAPSTDTSSINTHNTPHVPTGNTGNGGLNTHPPMYSPGSPADKALEMARELEPLTSLIERVLKEEEEKNAAQKITFEGVIIWYSSETKPSGAYGPQSGHLETAVGRLKSSKTNFQAWDVAQSSTHPRFERCLQGEAVECTKLLSQEAVALQGIRQVQDGDKSRLYVTSVTALKQEASDSQDITQFLRQMDLPISSSEWREIPSEVPSGFRQNAGLLFGWFIGLVLVAGLIIKDKWIKCPCLGLALLVIIGGRFFDPQGFAFLVAYGIFFPSMILGGLWMLSFVFGRPLRLPVLFLIDLLAGRRGF